MADVSSWRTFVDPLQHWAEHRPDREAFRYLESGEVDGPARALTFAELDERARVVGAHLADRGLAGEPVVLSFDTGLEFIEAFFGCMYAGAIPVPVPPEVPGRASPRLDGVLADTGARLTLGPGDLSDLEPAPGWQPGPVDPAVPAMLQYNSGPIRTPRGIALGHDNLLAVQRSIHESFDLDRLADHAGVAGVGWMPLYLDMGLVGHVLQPVYGGWTSVLMPARAILRNPVRWIEAIAAFDAYSSGGPCLAFELCARRVTDEQLAGIDLSGWEVAYCGAEPIRWPALEAFAARFASCGFGADALVPAYGLAEAALLVCGGEPGRAVRQVEVGGREHVSCGPPRAGAVVVVVDPQDGRPLADGEVGEIWISSDAVARGYHGQAEATAATFGATLDDHPGRTFLRTGDLGTFSRGELVVTGRLKDVIIVHGRNHFPADVEATVEACHPDVLPGGAGVRRREVDGREQLTVTARARPEADLDEVQRRVRKAVTVGHGVRPGSVTVEPAAVSARTSGSDAGAEPIAVVGMACRLPGGVGDPEGLWELLTRGGDGVVEVPPDRWDIDAYHDPRWDAPGKMVSRRGGFISGLDAFDPRFFEMTAGEAPTSDPQQRLLLETCWQALERAGRTRRQLRGSRTGVYVGICGTEYGYQVMQDEAAIGAYHLLGTAHSAVVGRLSYWLGLRGPNFPVDTACSSSLVAVHLACQALRGGECDEAVAAGVNVLLTPAGSIYFTKLGALSPVGVCRPFDAGADGYVRGEGCGAVVLARLSDALEAGDPILAVIRGSAVNQDGRSRGFTAPSGRAQQDVIRDALARGGLEPADLAYVEAHGTGTPVGDPVEIEALGELARDRAAGAGTLRVGSVKGAIGHLEGAAGIASLIKGVLMLQHRRWLPSTNFAVPTERVDWSACPVEVITRPIGFEDPSSPQVMGVSAFGFSGTNAHVVLQEFREPAPAPRKAKVARGALVVPVSARDPEALAARAGELAAWLDDHPGVDLPTAAWALANRTTHFERRGAVVAATREELAAGLRALAVGDRSADLAVGRRPAAGPPGVAWVFTGQGSQASGMGRALYDDDAVFRRHLDACAAILDPLMGRPLLEVMWSGREDLDRTELAQPALFALELALARTWRSAGFEPDVVLGHSVGEVVAAVVAGALSAEDGARLVAARGRLMQALPGGAMVAVAASEDEVLDDLGPLPPEVSVAAVNAPRQTVLSGPEEIVLALAETAKRRGRGCTRLAVSHAFHSPMMEAMQPAFGRVCEALDLRAPVLPVLGNVTGGRVDGRVGEASYWVEHVRATVRFADSVRAAREMGIGAFVEIGPRPTLSGAGRAALGSRDAARWLPTMDAPRSDGRVWRRSVAQLVSMGIEPDWARINGPDPGGRVVLPTYPFQRSRHWVERVPASVDTQEVVVPDRPRRYALAGRRLDLPGETVHRVIPLGLDQQPYLRDHVVHGSVVVPGAFYLSAALAVAAEEFHANAARLEDVQFLRPLLVDGTQQLHITLGREGGPGRWRITFASGPGEGGDFVEHVTGCLIPGEPGGAAVSLDLGEVTDRCDQPLEPDDLYRGMAGIGIELGPTWRWTTRMRVAQDAGEALGRVEEPAGLGADEAPVHPALLDNVFAAGLAAIAPKARGARTPRLPFSVDRLSWSGAPGACGWSHAEVREGGDGETTVFDLGLLDDDGTAQVRMEGFRARRAPRRLFMQLARPASAVYRLAWEASDERSRQARPRADHRVILAPSAAGGGELAGALRAARPDLVVTEVPSAAGDGAESASDRVGRVLVAAQDPAPAVTWVTCGAQSVAVDEAPDPAAAAVWGLLRVVQAEGWDRGVQLLDLEAGTPADTAARQIVEALDGPPQVAVRGGVPRVPRLRSCALAAGDSRPDLGAGTVLVTGGLGHLGLQAARELVEHHGAGHLTLVGRGAPTPASAQAVDRLRVAGAEVSLTRVDVADREALARLLDSLERPLVGIVHAAGVVEDAPIASIRAEQLARVLSPKVAGTWNLHELTVGVDLEVFTVFSSVASLLGSPGQGAYAAANAFADAVVRLRRASSLAAQSLVWGPWAGGGMVERLDDADRHRLERAGLQLLDPALGRALFGDAVASREVQPVLVSLDVATMARTLPDEVVPPPVRDLVVRARSPEASAGAAAGEDWRQLSDPVRLERIEGLLRREIARALALADAEEVPTDLPLTELGLDSLMAAELRARWMGLLGIDIPLSALFEYPTVSTLAAFLAGVVAGSPAVAPAVSGTTGDHRPPVEPSAGQRRLWFLDRLEERAELYHVHMELQARGQVSVPAVRAALAHLVRHHEALRTCFPDRGGRPAAELLEPFEPSLPIVDLSERTAEERQRELERVRAQQTLAPFDLAREAPVRFALVRLGAAEHRLLITQHHIATDGWSMALLVQELGAAYAAAEAGEAPAARPPARRFADFAVEERRRLDDGGFDDDLRFWRRALADLPALDLPTDRPRAPRRARGGATIPLDLPADVSETLLEQGRSRSATPFATVAALFATALGRVSGQARFGLGTVHANRATEADRRVLGFYVNTVVLPCDLTGTPGFGAVVERTARATVDALDHGAVPFDEVVRAVAPDRAGEHSPLFRACVVQETPMTPARTPTGVEILPWMPSPDGSVGGTAKFDLTWIFEVRDGCVRGTLEYATDLFDRGTVERLARGLQVLARAAAADPDRPVGELALLDDEARRALGLQGRGPVWVDEPWRPPLELFHAQVDRTPDAIAVREGDRSTTFAQLESAANRLAHHLVERGLGPGDRVALAAPRSTDTIVGMLGILGAGAAYVPLDPDDPPRRLGRLLEACAPAALVATAPVVDALGDTPRAVLLDAHAEAIAACSDARSATAARPEALAYVVFTSGSTGRPRGACVSHANLANYLRWKTRALPAEPGDRVLHKTSVGFDSAVGEIWYPLVAGAEMVVARPGGQRDMAYLGEVIRDEGITVFKAVPSLYQALLRAGSLEGCADLRLLLSGGEALPARVARDLHDTTGARVINLYGPAEATVSATWADADPAVGEGMVPIGRPIDNVTVTVVDPSGNPVPLGMEGELVIGGAGVGQGYLDDPDATAARFIPEPTAAGGRCYRTGDRVRWRGDGQLAFVGRRDGQVQIRGQRVEVGEVEAVLEAVEGVEAAAVYAEGDEPEDRVLIAHVEASTDAGAIRRAASEVLPTAMVPARIVPVASLPRLPSGKVDRRAMSRAPLPPAGGTAAAPLSGTQAVIAAIWREALGRDDVGPGDDFFELGGHSLLAVRVMIEVQDRFPGRAALGDLFAHPTLEALAGHVDGVASGRPPGRDAVGLRREARLPSDLPDRVAAPATRPPRAVFLTGATGLLGAHLARALLDGGAETVTCLVRAGDRGAATARLRDALETRDLWRSGDDDRLEVAVGDLAARSMGLSSAEFDALAGSMDAVVHNGAWVHHAHRYRALRATNVGGTIEAIRLAVAGRGKPLAMVSSLDVILRAAGTGAVSEEAVAACAPPTHSGYARTKWVAERIVELAGDRGLPVSIVRPSLILGCGDTGGIDLGESWLLLLLAACVRLGRFPDDARLPAMGVVPADRVAGAVAHVALRSDVAAAAYHLTHPVALDAGTVRAVLERRGYALEPQPYAPWHASLVAEAVRDRTLAGLAAVLPLPGDAPPRHRRVDDRATVRALGEVWSDLPPIEALLDRTVEHLIATGQLPAPVVEETRR